MLETPKALSTSAFFSSFLTMLIFLYIKKLVFPPGSSTPPPPSPHMCGLGVGNGGGAGFYFNF